MAALLRETSPWTGTTSAIAVFGIFFAVFSALVLGLVRAELRALQERVDGLRNEIVVRFDALQREMVLRFDTLEGQLDGIERGPRPDGEPREESRAE